MSWDLVTSKESTNHHLNSRTMKVRNFTSKEEIQNMEEMMRDAIYAALDVMSKPGPVQLAFAASHLSSELDFIFGATSGVASVSH